MDSKDLTQIREGQTVEVIEIRGGKQFQKKIDAIGLRVGSKIVKLSAQVLNGPVTIKIGSTKLAIGHGMAKKILVNGKSV
jgi:ferrous iron transport protein A